VQDVRELGVGGLTDGFHQVIADLDLAGTLLLAIGLEGEVTPLELLLLQAL